MKLDRAFIDTFADRIGPVGKSLGMLIRPAFVAPKGRTLVWGDWAAIEARVLPWLAGPPAEKKLEIFRKSDADKTKPDVYISGAAVFVHRDPQELWNAYLAGDSEAKKLRQSHGKVPELSLGFGGGSGALMKMAVNYKVYVDEAEAKHMVEVWRGANPWAKEFWGSFYTDKDTGEVTKFTGLWGAANMAIRNPGTAYTAGRVAYVFDRDYMNGTLFCGLPCGRVLAYPDCRYRTRKVKDTDTGEEREVHALWFKKGYGWSALWYGKLAENITQAVAGSILRETLKMLDAKYTTFETVLLLWKLCGFTLDESGPVGHTHDEAVLEVLDDPDIVSMAHDVLDEVMGRWRPTWRETLPLTAEVTDNWYYTKSA